MPKARLLMTQLYRKNGGQAKLQLRLLLETDSQFTSLVAGMCRDRQITGKYEPCRLEDTKWSDLPKVYKWRVPENRPRHGHATVTGLATQDACRRTVWVIVLAICQYDMSDRGVLWAHATAGYRSIGSNAISLRPYRK
nr:hypothetical protein CFP56_02572 [Quercus suber]